MTGADALGDGSRQEEPRAHDDLRGYSQVESSTTVANVETETEAWHEKRAQDKQEDNVNWAEDAVLPRQARCLPGKNKRERNCKQHKKEHTICTPHVAIYRKIMCGSRSSERNHSQKLKEFADVVQLLDEAAKNID